MGDLTPRQERFLDEYLVDFNGAQAAIRAGYSRRAARQQASRLLTSADVQAGLAARQRDLRERFPAITAERVLRELARIAFADMRRFASVGPGGITLKDSDDWTDDDAGAVAELAETTGKDGGSIRFKLHSKTTALDALGKHLGLFVDGAAYQMPARSELDELRARRERRMGS